VNHTLRVVHNEIKRKLTERKELFDIICGDDSKSTESVECNKTNTDYIRLQQKINSLESIVFELQNQKINQETLSKMENLTNCIKQIQKQSKQSTIRIEIVEKAIESKQTREFAKFRKLASLIDHIAVQVNDLKTMNIGTDECNEMGVDKGRLSSEEIEEIVETNNQDVKTNTETEIESIVTIND